jgi:glyoxylase-like metal-dependent hydrolase (beta-lactamase superfamily II)
MSSKLIRETFAVGPLGCNCSVIVDRATKDAIVVDPGGDADKILARLAHHGCTVKTILITHAHIDHLGAIPEVQRATNAPVLMHDHDRDLYENVDMQGRLLGIRAPALPDFDAIKDGHATHFGGGAIHTPGHTKGSMCFHFGGERLLITGDTLFAGGVGRTDLWGGSFDDLIRSIKQRLLVLEAGTIVVPGHGPETTIEDERRFNPFLAA